MLVLVIGMEGRVLRACRDIRAELKSCNETMPIAARFFDFAQDERSLFRRERFVKPCLATIGCVAMDDPALGRFVDRGNRRANLIRIALRR